MKRLACQLRLAEAAIQALCGTVSFGLGAVIHRILVSVCSITFSSHSRLEIQRFGFE